MGGLVGMLMLPIIMLVIVSVLLVASIGSAVSSVANGGEVRYNEAVFQEYTNNRYYEEFADSEAFEDHVLIVFLTEEDADGYYAIAWVGDNLRGEVNELFGAEGTAFGRAMNASINDYHAYSLSANLAAVMERMTGEVKSLGLDSPFRKEGTASGITPHVTNYSALNISKDTVNTALEGFEEETGICAVIVVDSMENVFGKSVPATDWFTVLILLVFAGVAIYMIVQAVRGSKKKEDDSGEESAEEKERKYNRYE